MAATKSVSAILSASSNTSITTGVSIAAAAGTKASPGAGAGLSIDVSSEYGASFLYKLTNSGAMGVAPSITFYVSQDNATWFELFTLQNVIASAGILEGAINVPPEFKYGKADVYGNTTSAVVALVLLARLTAI